MNRVRSINNMYLRTCGRDWTVLAPTKIVGRHPSYYRKIAEFVNKEEAILFMKTNLSYVSQSTRNKKSEKWIAIGTL